MSRSSPVPDQEDEDVQPRRGGRVRKQVERFEPPTGTKSAKGKEAQQEDDEDSDLSEVESDDAGPARKKRATGQTKKATTSKGTKGQKKKSTSAAANARKDDGDVGNATQMKNDCPLFNSLTSPDIALQSVVEDWVDTYQQTAGDETSERASVHELVQFMIRCCGLNADVEEDEALDIDGILDALERIQDESIQVTAAVYPLIAKTKEARTIRTNLDLFVPALIKTLSLTPLLYHTEDTKTHSYPILQLILNWLHTMSTSPLRPIRHTSTHLLLKICSALCDTAHTVANDLSLKQRQKDAEVKKGAQGPAGKKKLAGLEAQVEMAQSKKDLLEEYLQDSFNSMFVHRIRDLDPLIRTECLRELGIWAKKYGEMYVDFKYLNYFVRGCNDPDSRARLETVKALPALLANEANLNRARTLITRITPRLIEMSLRDVDTSVRTNALSVIADIEKSGILDDDDDASRSQIARLVFDREPKIRKAVGGFVRGLWEQRVDKLKSEWSGVKGARKKRAGKATDEEMETRFGYKALASLLLETAQSVDEAEAQSAGTSKRSEDNTAAQASRASAAVEALWDAFEELQVWEDLVEYLLLDHSQAEDIWLLEEDEESFLLQILVACIQRDERSDEEEDEQTKTLINVIPRLYTKHQADSDRMAGLLAIPERMKLSLYQEMAKTQAYEALWDDITKQFLDHTDPVLLTAAIKAIIHLTSNTSGETVNNAKLSELDETVFTSLRDAIGGEEVSSMSFDEDRLTKVEAILLRISLLQRSRNLTAAMEEDEEGRQSSGWDIVCAFAERGDIGYKEEAKVVEHAIQIVFLHLTWLFKNFTAEDAEDPSHVDGLKEKRDRAKQIFERLALEDRTNAADSVRRQGFIAYLNLHILFSNKSASALPAAKAVPMTMEDEIQNKLGGAFEALAERYASDREEAMEQNAAEISESDLAGPQMEFLQIASVFVGAIRCSILDVEHARIPLSHFGRFGAMYDAVVKRLVDPLRDEGIYNAESTTVQAIAVSALLNSFNLFLDTEAEDPVNVTALAKLIATAFVVQGNHFHVLRQIHPDEVENLHKACITELGNKLTKAKRGLASVKGKTSKERATAKIHQMLTFFRPLYHLLGPLSGKHAMEIKKHLEEVIGEIMPLSSGKQWDAYRAYEKRLGTIAGKDPNVKVVEKKRQAAEPTIEDTEDEDEDEVEQTPTKSMRKRKVPDVEEGDNLETETAGDGDAPEDEDANDVAREELGFDLDMDFDLELPEDEEIQLRSPSAEPSAKRRRTERVI